MTDPFDAPPSADLETLARLAKAANPSPWHIYKHPRDDNNWKANEEFHVAATPQLVLYLLAKAGITE